MPTTKPDKRTAAFRAWEVLEKFGIEQPSQIAIETIAAALNAIPKEEPLHGADGRLVVAGDFGAITVREDIPEPRRKRFVIAHELGHFILHRGLISGLVCDEKSFHTISVEAAFESEANYFAAEILMPENMFQKRVSGKDLRKPLLDDLCKEFNTSLTATAIRFAIMRPDYALVCSSKDRIEWFVVDRDNFPYTINIRGKVHEDSVAAEFFKGENSLPEGLFPIEPHAWLYIKWLKGRLKELAIPLMQYGRVLSFLYVDED